MRPTRSPSSISTEPTAADGDEALAKFREHSTEISLVLLDSIMPRMPVSDVLTAIQQTAPDLPIILVSGYLNVWGKDERSRRSVTLLQKPFDTDHLLGTVRKALDTRLDPPQGPSH